MGDWAGRLFWMLGIEFLCSRKKAPNCLFLRGLWIYQSLPIQGRLCVYGYKMVKAVKVPQRTWDVGEDD